MSLAQHLSTSQKQNKKRLFPLSKGFNIKKQISLINNQDLRQSLSKKESEKIYFQNMQHLENPDNSYLKKKVQGYIKNFDSLTKKRVRTQIDNMKPISLFSSIQVSKDVSEKSLFNLREKSNSLQRAILINQTEKIQRLIARRSEQADQFKSLSERMKIKLSPKKLLVREFKMPQKIEKKTWYKKWHQNQINEQKRKKKVILSRLKERQVRRAHTENVFNNIQKILK